VADYILPIADRDPLGWIISNQRTAVGAHRRREAEALEPRDRLFLYTTRGCFRNPTRDRSRIVGVARVLGRAQVRKDAVQFVGHVYEVEIPLRIESLAPYRTGVDFADLIGRLDSFPNRRAWPAYLRRALVPITSRDADLLASRLSHVAVPYREAKGSYAQKEPVTRLRGRAGARRAPAA
jgi:hypothetical protein